MTSIGLIGFGEVGGIFARDLMAAGHSIAAWDIAFADPASAQHARAIEAGLRIAASADAAAAGAEIVFVAVTAGATLEAAGSLTALGHAPFVVEVNSVAPATKKQAGEIVGRAGGRYVEAAIMTSVPPKGLRSPMLLGGPHAEAFAGAARPLGMDLTVFSAEIGRASSVKMCRSVIIKGLEAILTESMLAARHYGVEDEVLASLADTLADADWRRFAGYAVSRSLQHGKRRAEEMREVAKTVEHAGLPPLLSGAIAERQDLTARIGAALPRAIFDRPELEGLLDAVRSGMADRTESR